MPNNPWTDAELEELQRLLDGVPAPLEPLDVSMLDGYLCGVLVQPVRPPAALWLLNVTDAEGRPLPNDFAIARLHELVRRRHDELDRAIQRREWFDPWVFELSTDLQDSGEGDVGLGTNDAVYPWVAGFAIAMNLFPALMERPADVLTDPLALLYRHLEPDDLEDADQLLDAIAALPEPDDLGDAVQDVVRATFLLADVGRPLAPAGPAAARRGRPGRR
jgi:uncharacterized protein